MKFLVQKVLDNARLGLINGVERLPEVKWETPNVLLYTRGGTLPYLTQDIVQQITKENIMLYFPVPGIIGIHERMEKYNGNLGDFIGMPNYPTYVSVIDAGEKRTAGYHKKDHLPVWSKFGKTDVNCQTYMNFMEALKPDLFTTMCDSDTSVNSSNKRVFKSVERSLDFFKKCMDLCEKSESLKNSKVIGSLVGGFDEEAREKCSGIIGKAPVFGVSVDGLHDCSREVAFMNAKEVKPLVEASLKHVPKEMLRICHGSWNPNTILELVSSGIDIFDTSYPYFAAEDGKAFIFQNDESIYSDTETNSLSCNGNVAEDCTIPPSDHRCEEPSSKKVKITDSFCISLTDQIYTESLEPISSHCSCLTCKNHTKAYISHLLNVKELLGPTLLIIHNIHHYLTFFETIRTSLKNGKFENLKNHFNRKYCGNVP